MIKYISDRYRWFIAFAGILVTIFMIWYFSNIVIYIVIASVLSLIGAPLVEFLSGIRIYKKHLPRWISSLLTILFILMILLGFVLIFVPVISSQAQMIANMDIDGMYEYFKEDIEFIQRALIDLQLITTEEQLVNEIEQQFRSLMSMTNLGNLLSGVANITGNLFIGVFSVMFLAFFFLKDPHLLKESILLLTPDEYERHVDSVLSKTKKMLSRYFIGLFLEVLSMITLLSIGLTIFGIRNALMIGFLGGLMNIIPYLGPVIGAILGVILGVTTALSLGMYHIILYVAVMIVLTFVVSNLIDNIVLQPLIYSKSVNAHPIEIFLVILMAGSIAGIPGMILAIPTYTVIRIVAKEFLSGLKIVDRLTARL